MNYSNSDDSLGSIILKLIGCIILIIIISASSRACSRSDSNMVFIKDGYCYDADTKIIYKESIVGRYDDDTTYTIYYNENGNVCKYNEDTGKWIEVLNKNNTQ